MFIYCCGLLVHLLGGFFSSSLPSLMFEQDDMKTYVVLVSNIPKGCVLHFGIYICSAPL